MSGASCPRLFEAEAMRDGRLVGKERASFERHLETCAVCAREVRELERLAERLRETDRAEAPHDELHARRERTRLLAAFDDTLVAGEPSIRVPRAVWPAVGAFAVAIGAAFFVWKGRDSGQGEASRAQPSAIVAGVEAVWSKRIEDRREKIALSRGDLRIVVKHTEGEPPLLVELPDGELEDRGTTFSVSADGGRTMRVHVEEGSVVLRLVGRAPITIGAGGTWQRDEVAPPTSPVANAPVSPDSASASASSVSVPAATPSARKGAEDGAATDFRGAMAAFDREDHRDAATRFAAFLAKYPRDSRGEDAAYLRVIALQRAGDEGGTRDAAQDYLAKYPSGFRRAEVERLAR